MASDGPFVPYDLRWPARFLEERAAVLRAIAGKIVAIEHVGSTSVPGLGARPIIDILVAIARLDDGEACVEPLGNIGYESRPVGFDVPGTRYFPKGPSGARIYHLRMVEEVTIDREVYALDGQRRRLQPFRVGMAGGLAGRALAKKHDVGHDGRAFALEGIGRQTDGA